MDNIIGRKFNKWTIIGKVGNLYECQCQCGKTKMTSIYKINNNPTYSCDKCAKRRMFIGFSKMKKFKFVVPNRSLHDLG